MTTTDEIAIGQKWRQSDGYLCVVVAFDSRGWPIVRHPNAKQGGSLVNPAWFTADRENGGWERVR